MRRTVLALSTAAALGAGVLVVLPDTASAATAPKLLSVKASKKSVTTVGKYNAERKVTITAVYDDPDDVLDNVGFSTSGPIRSNTGVWGDYSPVESGDKRTFSYTFEENYYSKPGVRKVYVVGQVKYNQNVAGTSGSTSYVVKQKPILSFYGTTLMSMMWGHKKAFYGSLTSTGAPEHRKIKVQFKKSGTKKFVTKQKLRTGDRGSFFTKKFTIDQRGKWRATFGGTKYILAVKSKPVTAKPY